MPQWAIEEYGSDGWANGGFHSWSNGILKLDRWEHDVVIEMSKNEGYWDAEDVGITKVFEPIIPSESTVLAFERGEGNQKLDWAPIPAAGPHALPGRPGASRAAPKYVYPGIWDAVPSNGIKPFQDDEVGLKVRKALSDAVDRSRLVGN